MSIQPDNNIALLIDADNAPASKIEFIIAELATVGNQIFNQGPFDHRTYGFQKLSDMFCAINLFEVSKTRKDNQTQILIRVKENPAKKTAKKIPKKTPKPN